MQHCYGSRPSPRGPILVPDDKLKRLLSLMDFRDFGFEPTEASARVGDDSRQRLVNLMRDRCRHFADCQDPGDTSEFGFHLP